MRKRSKKKAAQKVAKKNKGAVRRSKRHAPVPADSDSTPMDDSDSNEKLDIPILTKRDESSSDESSVTPTVKSTGNNTDVPSTTVPTAPDILHQSTGNDTDVPSTTVPTAPDIIYYNEETKQILKSWMGTAICPSDPLLLNRHKNQDFWRILSSRI